jgi:hypothetical protein
MPVALDRIDDQAALIGEAQALSRLIVGEVAPRDFLDRYVTAHRYVFSDSADPDEIALLALAMRRRWLLPCIDAALALRRPDALLHRKALVMAAILEASPRYADAFLPRHRSTVALIWLSLRLGAMGAMQLAIGLPIVWWHRRAPSAAGASRP